MAVNLRIRKDITTLSNAELDRLVKAFDHICNTLPPTDFHSFYQIAGYHGMPFRGAGWANNSWWGGYCNHGNILFPTWHRAYLQRLEDALRTAPGCSDLALPYWNELVTQSGKGYVGVPPPIFLQENYVYLEDPDLKGKSIKNPLFSYRLQKSIVDNTSPDTVATHGNYTKLKNYETVRYPYSGLMGAGDIEETEKHNAQVSALGRDRTNEILCENVLRWLNMKTFDTHDGKTVQAGVGKDFEACLNAPNYTVFSNTTSAKAWNDDHMDDLGFAKVVPLETPHNKIHLAVGGFDVPGQGDYDVYPGANGDMGENNTASFDPIFYFHHCFIDLMFWRWQQNKRATDKLDIKYSEDVTPDYPGTNSVDSQGPTPGVMANATLTLDSPLTPFTKQDPSTGQEVPKTSRVSS
jgi:tyrosinase